jgi:deoxyribodipyrimidine photo-lyase
MKPYTRALHVFRRDLRLKDNTALLYALENAEKVIPCFILDKRQIEENEYRSSHAVQFMAASLADLDRQLRKEKGRLYLFYGTAEEIVEILVSSHEIDLVTVNRDYTPFSQKRDAKIQSLCHRKNVAYASHGDALLHEPDAFHKDDLTPYIIFTPFLKKARVIPVRKPVTTTHANYYSKTIEMEKEKKILDQIVPQKNPRIAVNGGRNEALTLVDNLSTLSDYASRREYPAHDATSHLSAHIKFGTVSVREVYHRINSLFGGAHTLITELYWRDFFTHIIYHFPRVLDGSFRQKYDAINWSNDKKLFSAWCQGNTGYPLVDAGMRELRTTGYMHNRARMVTASFLVKDLHIDWRWGEKYFAQRLIDYDPGVNNGNWQWAASTGCDAQPYFRIFNPWRQQKKYDPACAYIKKWIPELKELSPKEIHGLETPRPRKELAYPSPIVDHKAASRAAKAMYASVAKKN